MPPKKKPAQPPSAATARVFRVAFTEEADSDVGGISDLGTRAAVLKRAAALTNDPTRQGKALGDDLKGVRSVRAAGQRYRVLYRVYEQAGQVVIVVIGIRKEGDRKDVYNVASKRLGG